jgi:hypothetical protein
MELFRHCLGRGRRFHIKLENKKLVKERRESIAGRKVLRATVVRSRGRGSGLAIAPSSFTPVAVSEGKPIIIDIEEFRYAYKCEYWP